MLRFNLHWKRLFWAITIGTIILLASTALVFQANVDHIEKQLNNLKSHENH